MNIFKSFKWYRRLIGGRWEYWMHEPGYSDWYHHDSSNGQRPHLGCRGTPKVEVYE